MGKFNSANRYTSMRPCMSNRIRIFLKTEIVFLRFQRKIRIHTCCIRIAFARPYKNAKTMEIRQHPLLSMRRWHASCQKLCEKQYMMYYIIVFETSVFARPCTRKRKAGVFKNLHSRERFWKDAFPPDTCKRQVKPKKKISVFKQKRIRVDGACMLLI